MIKAKISKLMIWPSRTIGLPNYSSVTLNAGIEMVFDKPIAFDSKEITKAFVEARKVIKNEFTIQIEPYKELLKKAKGGEKNNG